MTTPQPSAPAFFRGEWMTPGHPKYEPARPVFNQRVDGRPEVIARCAGAADVVAALGYARERGLRVDVRSGGFNVGVSASNGMVIDLSLMRGVQILPERRAAWIQGGVRGGDLQVEAALHGLGGVTGAVSGAGVGLTLGGGLGFLSPRVGYASDNVLRVEVVTAAGDIVTASPEENADLFWAVRGSTGNFGVVTALEMRLHEVPPLVHAGALIWSLDNIHGGVEALRTSWEWAPDELGLIAVLSSASLDGRGGLEVYACHSGPAEQARTDVERLRSFGAPDEESVAALPFRDFHFVNDELFVPTRAMSDEVAVGALGDELVDSLVAKIRQPGGSGMRVVEITPRRGAFGRAPEFPSALRESAEDPTWSLGAACWWQDPSEDDEHERWIGEVCAEIRRIGPANDRVHPSGIGARLDLERVARMYGDRFERLRDLKRQWDPDNVFSGTHNIPPADS
ncbi:FAD-binding oxidoreductase [Rhodococcus koreensis]|uniref:FAD-binding oxidoreductase n=1 Tax=Rhodococcus koreensis TaxID=99653 RepID=UPI00366D909A